jgi:CRP/FNR family transcriptional regulator
MEAKNNVEIFFSKYKKRTYKKGELILRADQEISNIFYIKTGIVRQYIISQFGQETSLATFSEGSYFPIMIYIANSKNKYYFEAVEDSTIFIAPAKDVLVFVKDNKDVMFDLTKRMALGLNGMLEKVESLLQTSSYERVIRFLTYAIKKFGKDAGEKYVEVDFSHSDLASWIGLQRETVSRQIEKLEKKKIIISKNRKMLIDPTLLEKEFKTIQ